MKKIIFLILILFVITGCRKEYFHAYGPRNHSRHMSAKYYGKKQKFRVYMDQRDDYLNEHYNVFSMPLEHGWYNSTNHFAVWSYYSKNGKSYIVKSMTNNDTVVSTEIIKYPGDLNWLSQPYVKIAPQYIPALGNLFDKEIKCKRIVNSLSANSIRIYNRKEEGFNTDIHHVNPIYIMMLGEYIDTISDIYTRNLMNTIITYIQPELAYIKKAIPLFNEIQEKYNTPLFIAFEDGHKLNSITAWCFFEEDKYNKLYIRKIDANYNFTDTIISYSGDIDWLYQNKYNYYTLWGFDDEKCLSQNPPGINTNEFKDFLHDNPIYCRYNNLRLCDDKNDDWPMCRNEYSKKFGIHQNPFGVDSIICDTIEDFFMNNFYKAIRDYNIIPNVLK